MRSKSTHKTVGKVRIIGGKWRRRLLNVLEPVALRPTPDRVRETVFNWLDPHLPGARCLDAFAGSGVLGFEAASRGAAQVVLLENDPRLAAELLRAVGTLQADSVSVHRADALSWLTCAQDTFDIVFLDPPYHSDLLIAACHRLRAARRVRSDSLVYLESHRPLEGSALAEHWCFRRTGKAGQVRYYLASPAGNAQDGMPDE